MPTQQGVSNHYTHGSFVAAIRNGIPEDFLSQLGTLDPLKTTKADLQQRIIVEQGEP